MHYHHRNNTKKPTDSKHRMCHKAEHKKCILAVHITLVPFKYINRNNKVPDYIHWTIRQHMGLQVTDKYYKHIPERVITVNGTTIMWNVLVITDGTILANQPDIVQHDKKEKTCLLIDIAITDDSNVKTKETEKLSKYEDLEIKVSRSWKVRAKTLPVIIAALVTIKEGLDQNLQLLPGSPLAIELQKITLIWT